MNGITRYSLAGVNALTGNATSWAPACLNGGPSSPGYVYHMTTDGTNLYLTGYFAALNTTERYNMGAVSLATGTTTSWYPSFAPSSPSPLSTLAYANGNLYLGGNFSYCNGIFTPWLAKMNVTTGAVSSTWLPYPNAQVKFIKPYLNFLYTAGNFSTIHAFPISQMGIVDTGTNIPDPWNPMTDGDVNDVAVYNNKMYVAGDIVASDGKFYYKNLVKYYVNTHSSMTIITGPDSVCAGALATFNVTSTAPGATFQWRVNGAASGTGTSFTYTPSNGDNVLCVAFAAPGSCYSPDSALSNIKVITVNPHVTVAGPASVCAGIAVTDTAFAVGAGITYQWRINGIAAGAGNTHTYIPTNGDHITATIHGATGCPSDSATSTAIVMTVNPLIDILTGITASDDTICAGTTISAVAHSQVAGTHFSWKVNNVISGTDDSTYTYVPAMGDVIKCVVTAPAGGCYMANPDSISITPVVQANIHPALTATGNTLLCNGDTATYTVSPAIAGATYTWYKNGTTTGATGLTYNYTPANGDLLKSIATLPTTGCYTSGYDTSNTLTILVNANVTPVISITAASTNVCLGSHATFYSSTPGMAGATYQWKVNSMNVGTSTPAYTYVPANGDNVQCVITAPATGCFTGSTATSNTISITTTALTVPAISISAPAGATPGSIVTVAATVANAGASYLISWYKNTLLFNTSTTPSTTYIKGTGPDNIMAKVSSMSLGCYDTTFSSGITVTEVVDGVNDIANSTAIQVYPNPFNDQLIISGLSATDKITLSDYTGRTINDISVTVNGTEQILRTSNIVPGIYLLRVTDINGHYLKNVKVRKD